jgi:hypothetical protein
MCVVGSGTNRTRWVCDGGSLANERKCEHVGEEEEEDDETNDSQLKHDTGVDPIMMIESKQMDNDTTTVMSECGRKRFAIVDASLWASEGCVSRKMRKTSIDVQKTDAVTCVLILVHFKKE